MLTVLGIDAAWTAGEPSGVALVTGTPGSKWRCVRLAPSYETFINDEPVDWQAAQVEGCKPDVEALLDVASKAAGQRIDVVAIDMPLSTETIVGRRVADNAVSKAFGKYGCGTHTPNIERPGQLGADLSEGLKRIGFPLETRKAACGQNQRLIEVYPHPALLRLLNADYRVPYKANNTTRYWRGKNGAVRVQNLLNEYQRILRALSDKISDIKLKLPPPENGVTFAFLKRYEDALDALVCAWVGIMYLEKKAAPHGDETAAIWIPEIKS